MARAWLLIVLALSACTTGNRPPSGERDADQCSDGVDNDGDSLVDCADPACTVHAWCDGGGVDAGGVDAGAPVGADAGPPTDAGPGVGACADPLDVVFVIDVSTSMTDEVAGIREGIDRVWTATRGLTANSQISLVVFVDDVAVVNGCSRFMSVEQMQTELMMWQSFTSTNAQPGGASSSNMDCAENSLDAMYAAATTCPWRDDSYRVLVHITDDTFEERPAVLSAFLGSGGIPVQHTYAETVAALTADEVRVGAFAAPGAGEPCGAGSSPDVGRGFHAPFMGAPSIPEATGGRAWSIRDVRAGSLDMAEVIVGFVTEEYCTLY